MVKPIVLRQIAERDIDAGFSYYLREAGGAKASDFIDSLDAAFDHIQRHPGTGSMRYGEWLEAPGLRSWLLNRFPYMVIYVEQTDHLDIIRVLHQQSDIPTRLQE